jgi:hypothetical protein
MGLAQARDCDGSVVDPRRRSFVSGEDEARFGEGGRAAGLAFNLRSRDVMRVRCVLAVMSVGRLLRAIAVPRGDAPHRLANVERHAGHTRGEQGD